MKTTVTDKYGTRVYDQGGRLISGTPLPSTPTTAPKTVTSTPAAKAPVVPTGGGGSSGGGSAPNYAQSGYAMPSGGTAMVTDSMKQQMIANAAKQGKDVSGNFYGIDVPAWQTAINLGADHSIANRVARGEIGLSDLPSLMTSPRPVALGGYLADGSPFQSDQAFWNSFDTGIQKAGYSPDYSRLAREAVFDQLDAGTYGQPINLSALVPQSGQANAEQQGINWSTYLGDLARRYSDPGYDAGRATPDRILTEMQRVSQAQGIPMPSMGAPLIPTAQIPVPLPQYQPYEPKPFVPQPAPFRITSAGDETWTPTGAAVDAWHQQEADRSAQYDKQFGIQYGIQQDAQERQRLAEQEAGNRRAAEQEIQMQAQEAAYKQAYDRWNAAGVVVSDADAQILGVPKGTKTSDHSYRLASTAISQMKAAATGAARAPKASTPKSTQTERDRAALADAYGAIHAAFAQGLTADQIEQNIRSQQAELTRRGIDPKILVQYAYDNDPNTPATNKKPGLWSQIDQRLGGWLPLGTPRK